MKQINVWVAIAAIAILVGVAVILANRGSDQGDAPSWLPKPGVGPPVSAPAQPQPPNTPR